MRAEIEQERPNKGRNMLMLFAFDLFCLPKNDNSMD